MIWPGCRLPFCQSHPGPCVSFWRFLICKLGETCPRITQISWSIDIPTVIDAAFMHNIQVCMCSSGDVSVFQWIREWFFSRRVKFDSWFNVMAVWSFLTWTKSFITISLEVVEVETLLILQENLHEFLLELDVPKSRWMFSVPDLLQKVWFVHLRLEK